MFLTPGNFDKYFPGDRYINVPHKEIFTTLIVHGLIIFAAQVLFFNVLAIISTVVLLIEAYYAYAVIYKMWKMAGYSVKLLIIGGGIYLFISFAAASFVRDYLLSLI